LGFENYDVCFQKFSVFSTETLLFLYPICTFVFFFAAASDPLKLALTGLCYTLHQGNTSCQTALQTSAQVPDVRYEVLPSNIVDFGSDSFVQKGTSAVTRTLRVFDSVDSSLSRLCRSSRITSVMDTFDAYLYLAIVDQGS
jgi:hypothetical protein